MTAPPPEPHAAEAPHNSITPFQAWYETNEPGDLVMHERPAEAEPRFSSLRDRLRDPFGWFLDALPWRIRKLRFAWALREWPWNVADEVRIVGCRRPPRHVFDYFRELHRDDIARAADSHPRP